MISINTIKIDEFAAKIDVNISTTTGNNITKVLLWTSDTFKDYTKAIDFSSKLDGSDNTETFSIHASELELTKITGLYFLEFESNEVIVPGDNNSNVALGVTANFIQYHECVLNKLLKIEVDGCKPVINTECDECEGNVPFISSLLQALKEAVKFGFYEEAIKIIKNLDDLCDICHTCPDYGNTLLINGLGFGTENNSIILI